MSDLGRKSLGDQAQEKLTPNSQKSTLDQAKEGVTGAYDRAAGSVQSNDSKSATQQLGDSTRSGTDQGQGYLQQAQEGLSNAAQSVSDTLSGNTQKK